MPLIPTFGWNLCTTFAAIGAGLAYAILIALFGIHPQLVPSAIAGLLVGYTVSTVLGALINRLQAGRYLTGSIIIGIGAALITLIAGTIAIGVTNFVIELIRETVRVPSGQPAWNVLAEVAPSYAQDFIGKPFIFGLLFGSPPALILGSIFGVILHSRFDVQSEKGEFPAKSLFGLLGGAMLLILLLSWLVLQAFGGKLQATSRPFDMPVAVGSCGAMALPSGMLAYCLGHPCEQGQCQWETEQDVFALYVRPPVGSKWSWSGGGLGTTRKLDVIKHTLYWVQREPNGDILDSSPRRAVHYQLRFDGNVIEIGKQRFQFEPGMLLVIEFADDWSVTAGLGNGALRSTGVTIEDLQRALDKACAIRSGCEGSLQIRP